MVVLALRWCKRGELYKEIRPRLASLFPLLLDS